jgi:hypothetical protein
MNVYGAACSEMLASPGSIAKRLKQFALLNYPFSFFRALLLRSVTVIGSGAIMIGVVVIDSRAIAMVSGEPNNPFHFSF